MENLTNRLLALSNLVCLADALRKAQKAYMLDRGNNELGKKVGRAADAYDHARANFE